MNEQPAEERQAMTRQRNETERERNPALTGFFRKESGFHGCDSMDHQYGRRIEVDQSWTVYHVFTGVPAYACGKVLTGLSEYHATSGMLSLNIRNIKRRETRFSPLPVTPRALNKAGCSL